jgi:hypothetical protein
VSPKACEHGRAVALYEMYLLTRYGYFSPVIFELDEK